MVALATISMVTMFEIFGRTERRFDSERMKKIHRVSGRTYFLLFTFIMYFCLSFIITTKAELSTRAAFHTVFALTILVLFALKLLYLRIYRQYYERVKIIGLLMALLTFGLVGTSAGYYLLVSKFGTDRSFDTIMQYKKQLALAAGVGKNEAVERVIVKSDSESIGRGKNLFDSKCKFCHHANSTETTVGPGLEGILKKRKLPVSKLSATPENVIRQLKQPFNRMPSFEYLTDEEISDIMAFLNTL
jgi:mono/diheme cytochrome c family protein